MQLETSSTDTTSRNRTGQEVSHSDPLWEDCRSPWLLALILTHIFLGRPEKPITMDVFVNQSTVALGLSRCFIKLNCKMWVKDRARSQGLPAAVLVNTRKDELVINGCNVFPASHIRPLL